MGEVAPDAGGAPVWDTLFGGQLRLAQLRTGHRVGTDAVLLAAAAAIRPGECFVDAGAGVGAVGLEIARREPGCRGVLLELDAAAADLAARNAAANRCSDRVAVSRLDLLDKAACRDAGLVGKADLVVSNPPFYMAGTVRMSSDASKATAHVMPPASLHSAWAQRLCDLVAPNGRVVLVHRPDAMPSLLPCFGRGFGGIVVKPIQAREGRPAIRILLGAIRNSRAPASILAPLVLHTSDNTFTPEADAVHHGAPLRLWTQKSRPRRAGSFAALTVDQ